MLEELKEFRDKLDNLMCSCMDKTIVIYGYGYSGRFVAWYADYYHSIKPRYLITEENSSIIPYEYPLFRNSLFEFDYNRKGSDTNIQFMRYLEKMHGYDIVDPIQVKDFTNSMDGMRPCVNLSPKEIFPILDKCHCIPQKNDAIFDFGCGKGSALFSFLDYGFSQVGGVEYADNVYEILTSNAEKLCNELNDKKMNCYHGDAALVKEELDEYNWFYLFDPFGRDVFEKVINNICESFNRRPRKIWIINILPKYHDVIEKTGRFVLTNQFEIMTRQRVVNIYVSKFNS